MTDRAPIKRFDIIRVLPLEGKIHHINDEFVRFTVDQRNSRCKFHVVAPVWAIETVNGEPARLKPYDPLLYEDERYYRGI